MTPADWDREPTSVAERARWRVSPDWPLTVETVDGVAVGGFACASIAEAVCWAHNVLHAAREQRALGVGLHDGCVAREALVQVGWAHCGRVVEYHPAAASPCLNAQPVYRLRTDEDGQAT